MFSRKWYHLVFCLPVKDHKPNIFKHICERVFVNQNSETVIVSDLLCKHLCLYAWERKMKNTVLFQVVCIFVMHTCISSPVYAKTERLIQGGVLPQSVQHWRTFMEVFSCALLRATCKTKSQVDLHNQRLAISLFAMQLSPSFPSSLSLEPALTWADFALLTWILPPF